MLLKSIKISLEMKQKERRGKTKRKICFMLPNTINPETNLVIYTNTSLRLKPRFYTRLQRFFTVFVGKRGNAFALNRISECFVLSARECDEDG